MHRSFILAAALGASLLAPACHPSSSGSSAQSSVATCSDGAPALAVSGLCAADIAKSLPPAPDLGDDAEHCSWGWNEVPLADGSETVLYRALTCNGVKTELEFAGGAHSFSLNYKTSALSGSSAVGHEMVRVFVSDPADPQKAIRDLIEAAPVAERPKCEVHAAGFNEWPKDALVIGYNETAARTLPKDEPNAVCGEFGLDEDTTSYWLIRGGYAMFFQLGQDAFDLDPASFTVLARGADGKWVVKR